MIRIPMQPLPAYDMSIVIEGRVYVLTFTWNSLYAYWSMDIRLDNGDVVLVGRKLVTGFGLIGELADPRLPPGDFIVVRTDNSNAEPGRFDFQQSCSLLYLTAAETSR